MYTKTVLSTYKDDRVWTARRYATLDFLQPLESEGFTLALELLKLWNVAYLPTQNVVTVWRFFRNLNSNYQRGLFNLLQIQCEKQWRGFSFKTKLDYLYGRKLLFNIGSVFMHGVIHGQTWPSWTENDKNSYAKMCIGVFFFHSFVWDTHKKRRYM